MSIDLIIKLVTEKSALQQKVTERTAIAFEELKKTLQDIEQKLSNKKDSAEPEVGFLSKKATKLSETPYTPPVYSDKGEFEVWLDIAGDTIIFIMHRPVFSFDPNHPMWKTSYVQEDKLRSFCGSIYIYNFLSDSIKYERENDIGYLIARIFVNSENHFFVEGKRQLGFLYNDFANATLGKEEMQKIVESAILYSLDFDPFNPLYDQVNQVSVKEILDATQRSKIARGKRLGFHFSADSF